MKKLGVTSVKEKVRKTKLQPVNTTYKQLGEQLYYHDYLTELPNHFMLEERLFEELDNSRGTGSKFAILLVDLKRFRVVNMGLGYLGGDRVLIEVTTRLKNCIGTAGDLFRRGTDELAIILSVRELEDVSRKANEILNALSYPIIVKGKDVFVSPRIGISLFPKDGSTMDELLEAAGTALCEAKKDGKSSYYFYQNKSFSREKWNQFQMEMDLHKACERKELVLHYQPKVNLKTGEMIGVEALVRWEHPKWGLVPPGQFIPIAEESGLIIPIGEWVLETACIQNRKWQKEGINMVMSVNLSVKQIMQTGLVESVSRILEKTGHDPSLLELEITESVTSNYEETTYILKELKNLGIKLSMDDFGSGFSSLIHLKDFPIDTIKIDRSFITDLKKNSIDETLAKTIITLGHDLKLKVVAEGIETKEQLQILQYIQCDEGQGFYFSKPIPASGIAHLIDKIKEQFFQEDLRLKDVHSAVTTKKKHIDEEEREETLRKLTAGVAHEIRNPITSVKGFVHFIEQGEGKQEYIDIINSSIQQIEEYIDKLLLIGRSKPNLKRSINIQSLLNKVVKGLESTAKLRGVHILLQFERNIPDIPCDPEQINTVFQQLISNSLGSMLNGGTVRINVGSINKNIRITVIDNGSGMSKGRLEKLGEPFYSNKEVGTGLGFLLCNQTVREHGGHIKVATKEGEGTRVEVILPVSAEEIIL
ncbi:diguanylate cyclase (GGDEF)-like protein [Evansella vedderi]|uniref:histidine kinase n=1 Tax=Evansella vedderi TaxID=38282 RepID=A0ABT9ZPD4_9BACI|nr:EAL domain-containing protein [Evansella vedderi]MDQ0253054.1 diguanylate cyclase (GGDEF)-like protein [Evansella vedderi]